jgi:CheY-like chemotaxis protein
VLVAEDDDGVRRLIVSTLREHGYEVLATGSAEEALDRARQRADVALLISDMVMPGLNGVELQRRLRASHANVRTLFVSGYATGALASPSAPTDCPMLQKPFTPSALQAAVWAVLNDEEPAPPAR